MTIAQATVASVNGNTKATAQEEQRLKTRKEVEVELAAWSFPQQEQWPPLEPAGDDVEAEILRRSWSDVRDDRGVTLGTLLPVKFHPPERPEDAMLSNFRESMRTAHVLCGFAFQKDKEEDPVLKRFGYCVWLCLSFVAKILFFRYHIFNQPIFQGLVDAFITPETGVVSLVNRWVSCSTSGAHDQLPPIAEAMEKVIERIVSGLREAQKKMVSPDDVFAVMTMSWELGNLAHDLSPPVLAKPSPEDVPFAKLPKIEWRRFGHVKCTRILSELRASFADPDFQSVLRSFKADSAKGQATFQSGSSGVLHCQYDILKRNSLEAKREGIKEFCRQVDHWARTDAVCRKLALDLKALLSGTVPKGMAVPRAEFGLSQRVRAFFNTYELPEGRRLVYLDEPPQSSPVIGLSAGWLPGVVVSRPAYPGKFPPCWAEVTVKIDGCFYDPRDASKDIEELDSLEFSVPLDLVRPHYSPPSQPLLSIMNIRSNDYWIGIKWSDFDINHDGYHIDLLQGACSLHERAPGEYEILTAFIRHSQDLQRLDPVELRSQMKGRNVIAWYFLWPSMNCKPGYGAICERQFFALAQRMERAKFRGGWPHTSHTYRLLSGKLWVPQMCLNSAHKVPPTTRVNIADFRSNPQRAGLRALEHLNHLRKVVWGETATPFEEFRGVVKFGFSWCGCDVVPFKGLESLEKTMEGMFARANYEQTYCLVQQMVPNVLGEYRLLCMYDKGKGSHTKECMWMGNQQKFNIEGFTMASSNIAPREKIGAEGFKGDMAALQSAEDEAGAICDRWLLWARTESPEPLQCTRVDFLVNHMGPGQAGVWTCEVGECGGSLCGTEVHGRNTTAYNNAILRDDSGRFPAPLPWPMPRNDGYKS